MSTTVVPAPADQATRPVRSDKPANQTEKQQAVREDEERLAQDDSEDEVSVSAVDQESEEAVASETSLAGDFTFGGALAEAAASSGSLITEAEEADQVGFSQFGDGNNTILLVGAVALVALGIVVLADGGGSKNEAPTAEDASASTGEDTPVDVAVTASDPDGDALTYSAGSASNGTVSGGTGGTFTYTPDANFNGSDSFTVTVTDPDGETATATVSVTIAAAPDPVSGPASQDVSGDEEAAIAGSISLTDPDAGDTVTYAITAPAANGIVVLAADGSFTYTGADDFFGADAFTVTATSSDGSTADQVVNVAVANVNDAPVQGAGTTTAFNVQKDGSATFDIDFSDVDGDTLSASSTDPANGSIDPATNTYTPDAGFSGTDTFDVTVSDGNGGDVTYTVTANVIDQLIENIDVPASGAAVTFDAGSGDVIFADDAGERTDVILTNFSAGDSVQVTGIGDQDEYFYTSNGDDDLIITRASGSDFTQIVIEGVAVGPNFVFDYASAVDSIGFDFITIA